jgi:hypothetical protein
MRLSPSRPASSLTLAVIVSMALVQAGAATEVDGIDRDLHVRVTPRVGAQRLDADGGHAVGDVEGAALTIVEQATPDQGLATLPDAALAPPAPTEFLWLSQLVPVAPATAAATAPTRGRAPPAA